VRKYPQNSCTDFKAKRAAEEASREIQRAALELKERAILDEMIIVERSRLKARLKEQGVPESTPESPSK